MATEVTMPKLGLNMTEGRLVEWLVEDGKPVRKGQQIFVIETDKVSNEAEATTDGILRHSVAAGMTIPVMGLVGYILQPGEELPATGAHLQMSNGARTVGQPAEPTSGDATQPRPAAPMAGEMRASPLARRLAQEAGIDLATIKGTGEGGRISREDVEAAIAARKQGTTGTKTTEPGRVLITSVRALIAERMLASSQRTAPVTLTTEVDANELVQAREQMNARQEGQPGFPLSYNALLMKIVAIALKACPYMNARQEGEAICLLSEVHIGLAIDTERGLLVPVIQHADTCSLAEISQDLKDKTDRARTGKSSPDELSGGTFTITNLGMFGIDAFTPIINLPELAILGVGRIVRKPVEYAGELCLRERMTLSLTFDHRLVDGAPAAHFLQYISQLIESSLSFIR
jgi:pyruvate dehydrogenase E2 component (dihydrolipoamide acetyltransferase)